MKSLVIGICGGSGSGKTTIAERLMDAFPNEAVILSHDFYYRRNDHLTFEERCKINYDHPDSLETSLMIEHLKALRDGQTVTVPQYDFTVHNRSNEVLVLEPRPIIIVEGILIFNDEELVNLMDIRVYVDTLFAAPWYDAIRKGLTAWNAPFIESGLGIAIQVEPYPAARTTLPWKC